jgi:hypothetical protein
MKVLLAIPSATGYIPLEIMAAIMSQEMPEDTELAFAFTKRVMIDKARSDLAEQAIKIGADYIWFVDDDTIPPRDSLRKMLELAKDITGNPVLDRNGEGHIALKEHDFSDIKEFKETREVGYCGMSNTLVKVDVVKAVKKEFSKPFQFTIIKHKGELLDTGEDLTFCYRAKLLGFKVWAMHDICPIHIGNPQLWKYKND